MCVCLIACLCSSLPMRFVAISSRMSAVKCQMRNNQGARERQRKTGFMSIKRDRSAVALTETIIFLNIVPVRVAPYRGVLGRVTTDRDEIVVSFPAAVLRHFAPSICLAGTMAPRIFHLTLMRANRAAGGGEQCSRLPTPVVASLSSRSGCLAVLPLTLSLGRRVALVANCQAI